MPLSPLERKAALVMAQVKQSAIARSVGLSQAYVSDVIAGNRRSEKIERAVAAAIGLPVDEVFEPRESAAAA
jgi:hypothetical protein